MAGHDDLVDRLRATVAAPVYSTVRLPGHQRWCRIDSLTPFDVMTACGVRAARSAVGPALSRTVHYDCEGCGAAVRRMAREANRRRAGLPAAGVETMACWGGDESEDV